MENASLTANVQIIRRALTTLAKILALGKSVDHQLLAHPGAISRCVLARMGLVEMLFSLAIQLIVERYTIMAGLIDIITFFNRNLFFLLEEI